MDRIIDFCFQKSAIWVLVFGLFCFQPTISFAQYYNFIESGEIVYEKKVNMHAKVKNRSSNNNALSEEFANDYRKTMPRFYSEKKSLLFTPKHSLFKSAGTEAQPTSLEAGEPWVIIKNNITTDFETDSVLVIKQILGDKFVISDKKDNILWKYTNEERDIAGYKCKRANGLFQDSIYVVAFYSESIIPAGGPESFCGLPGMILGVALPHENVSWFATKVTPMNIQRVHQQQVEQKKTLITKSEFQKLLKERTKNWGSYQKEAQKAFSF